MPTPEVPIQGFEEHPTEPIISEQAHQSGVQVTPTNAQPLNDNKGNPIITTPATQNVKIQIPSDQKSLVKKAKGSITDAATWLARFFLRILNKQKYANTTND